MWMWLLLLLLLCVVAAGAAVLVYMYYRCPQKLLFLLLPWMQRAYILYTKLQSLRPSRNQHSSIRHSPGAPAGAGGVGRTSPFFDDDASGKKSFARHHQPPQQKQHPYASLFHSEQHRSRSLWDDQVATSSYSTEQKKRNDIHAAPRRINEPGISSGNQWTRDTRHLRHRQRLQQQQQQQQYEKRHAPQTQDEEKTDWVYESDESRTDNNRPTSRGHEKSGRPTQPLSTAAAPTAAATCTQEKETPVVQLQPVAPGAAAEVSPQPELEKEAAAPVLYDDGRRVDALQVLEERDTAARAVHEEVERSHAAADEEENVTSFSVSSLSSCRKKEEEEKESSNRNAAGNASLGGDECADLSLSDVGTPQTEIKPIFAGIEAATGAAALTTAAASDMEGETLRSTPLEETLSRKKEEGTGAREAVCVAQKEEEGSAGAFVAAAELGNEVTIEEAEERDSAASTCMQNNPSLTVPLSETLVSHDEGVSRTSFSTAAVESALDAAPYSEEAFPSPADDAAVPGATATGKRKFAFPVAAAARAAAAAEAAAVGAPRSVQRLLQEEKEQQEMQGDDEREEDDDSSQREDEEDGGRGGGEEEEEENIERDRTMYGRRFPPGGDTRGTVPKSCTNFTAGNREGREGGKEEKNLASVAKKVHSAGERNSEKAEDEKTQDTSPDGVSLPRAEGGTRQGRKKATEKEVEKEKGEVVESSAHGRGEGERREGEVHSSVSQIEEEQERERQESTKRKEVKKEEDGRSSSDEEEDATAAELKEKGNKKFRAASYDSAQEYYTLALDRLDEEEDDWLDEWDAVMQEKEEELEAAEALRQKKRREVQRYRSSSTVQGDKGSSEDEEVSSEEARESEEAEAELEKEAAGEKRVVEASSSEAKPEDAEGQQKEQRSPERREKEGEGGGGHGDQQQEEKKHKKKKKKKEEKSDDGLLTEEGFEQFRVAKEKEREAKQQECNNLRAVLLANRAACHMQSGGWQQVLADCTEAIQCDSSYAKAYLRRYTANQALSKWHDALADINKALELDPSLEGRYRAHQQRVKKLSEQQFEKEKEEMLGKLKDFGNFVLGKVGLSLDNFKVEQNPETGSYNISFQQNAPAASSSTA